MKKLIFLFTLAFAFNSCDVHDNESQDSEYRTLPVEGVVMPAEFHVNTVNDIIIEYRRPTNCYSFDGFYYDKIDNIRVVAINAIKFNQNNCEDASDILREVTLHFEPKTTGPYIFKFFTGTDEEGEDEFITYNIEVLP